jgi:hypothetical protein
MMTNLRILVLYSIIVLSVQPICTGYTETSGITAIHSAPTFFVPNQTIRISVEITYGYTLTALGMIVTLPEGFSFVQTSGVNASEISPKIDNNTVLFGWVNNLFPKGMIFSYDIKVPSYAKSDQIIRAEIRYRKGASEEKNQKFLPDPLLIQADVDQDGDDYPNSQDAFPNDPNEWIDTDGDNIGNNADTDDDGDGMPDYWEIEHGFSSLIYNADDDPDRDGVSNIDEYENGTPPLNYHPVIPELISPVSQASPLTTTLQTGPFNDVNETDTHYASDWQLSKEVRFENLVYNIKTTGNQLKIDLPNFLLDPNTTYFWRVRHYDNYKESSLWATAQFQTTDLKNFAHGVPVDQNVPDDVDLDNNGVYDNLQAPIKSLTSIIGNVQVGMRSESPDQFTISVARSIDPDKRIAETQNRPAELPFGMLEFKIHVATPGDIAVVTVHYSSALPENALWYTYNPHHGWKSYMPQMSVDRTIITLMLKDGGDSDIDGLSNGVIVDPSGPGIPPSESSGSASTPELIDDVDNGSCFIQSVLMCR